MVGQETVIKPSRSDEVLDPDHQLQITNQVRAHFDSMVPKRSSKPNRSDPDSFSPSDSDLFQYPVSTDIPELDKLQYLRSQTVFISDANPKAVELGDEFVETQYYKQLDSIDKQHHTTGNGFIKAVSENVVGFERGPTEKDGGYDGSNRDLICKSNPATNDWIPSLDHDQIRYCSSKPNRSETY